MKQIFDWLREQMRNKAYKAWDGDNKREIMLITLPIVENIINEVEAKWEVECCIWKQEKILEFSLSDCLTSCGHAEHYSVGIDKYCRHCGKPIKISEVE